MNVLLIYHPYQNNIFIIYNFLSVIFILIIHKVFIFKIENDDNEVTKR